MNKYILYVTLLVSLLLSNFYTFAQNGTATHPYPISDKNALITLAQRINEGLNFSFENGVFVKDPNGDIPAYGANTCFEQTADIDLNGETWFPIGNSLATGFRGTYLGNGKKIQHLTLTADKPALFCYPNSHIEKLIIENPVFSGTINYGGALATFVMGGTIDSCHVTGNNLVFNGRYCGALIGCVGTPYSTSAGEITISHCSNSCNITSNYIQEDNDSLNSVAGVVACIQAQRYHVTHCFNTGNIISTYRPEFQKDTLCFAGVVGRGFLPTYPSEITYCYNTGDITAHCGYLGGVAGFFSEEGGVTNNTRCAIDYCFNTGDITGISVLHTDNPTVYMYADTNLDVFSLGGVVAPSKTKTRYCFNTGNITLTKHPHPKFSINGDQGVAGVGSIAEHCFNVGEINNYEKKTGRAAGVCRDTANHCFNAGCVYDRNPKYTFTPHNIAQVTYNSASDEQMSVDGQDGNLYHTAKVIGEFSSAINSLGNEYWIYETGRYPRLKWTDSCDWARDVAKVACTPIILTDTVNDIHHVTNGLQLTGCDSGVVWKAPAGNCLFDNSTLEGETCTENNSIQPTVQNICNDPVTVAATWNGDTIKTVTLIRRVAATLDTIPVNSLDELKALRDGINSGEAFFYGDRKYPRYAEGVTFKLTTDLDMQNEKPWESIGSVFYGSRFAGTFLGQGHTIANLSLDNDSIYFYRKSYIGGLFGMLSGEVRDLHFTNVHADSTVIVAGAVCALMNKGKIENCVVKGHIGTSSVNNNYATCGIGSIAGASLTTRIQDGNHLLCRDTIVNCVNYANIVTQVGRGTNLAAYSVGGIIGHGGVVMDCINAGDIFAGDECGFLGGIGGDLTSARRCFNTGRITIEKAPQFANYYVGGVVGLNAISHAVQYCYNAGSVDGIDRNHTGGIMGFGDPEYCYFSNTLTSEGAHVGSITGASSGGSDQANHCYYDKQMSPVGGVNGTDNPGKVEGLATTAMLGTALQNRLGVDTNWVFTEGLYPQLAIFAHVETQHAASLRTPLSRVSVMPVLLDNDQTWTSAHDTFSLGGCNEHYFWEKLHGNIKGVNGCEVTIGAHAMGTMEFAATFDSIPYRHIKLKFNLDEDHALIVKNKIQLDSMRRVINNAAGGYYSFSDSTFHTKIPANTSHDDFIAIQDGGNERFFKLINDIDLSGLVWFPIGGYTDGCCAEFQGTPFKGTFDGCGHTVRHLWLYWYRERTKILGRGINNYNDTCYRHQGLFGRIEGGTVKNLRIAQSIATTDPDTLMGGSSAFLCSENHGTLYNCEIDSCTVTVCNFEYGNILYRADTLALLCAINEGGLIDRCRVLNSQMVNDRRSYNSNCVIGAVCALNRQGVVQNCRVKNLYFEDLRGTCNGCEEVGNGSTRATGGICGKNYHGQLLNDTIKNSRFLFRISPEHQNIGGICGINGDDNDNTDLTLADIPSIIKSCLSDSTIINGDTCVQGNCQKVAINFGGIVGLSQGHIVQIEGCETTANSQLSVAADSVGGICGRFVGLGDQSSIRDCNNHAPVKGYGYVGGIVGLVTNATINSCSNSGNVWSALDATISNRIANPSGYYAGGIAGACIRRVTINNCNNEAGVKADSSYVGGIAGALLNGCQIRESSNSGMNATVSGINQVGGIVGLMDQDAWFGFVTGTNGGGCANSGLVKGVAQVGGLVGYAKSGTVETRLIASPQPYKGHNSGTVQYASMGGRVCGYAEDPSLFADCTYDTNTTGQGESVTEVQDIVTLTTIRNNVNNGTDNYEGKTIKLTENLFLSGNWTPIGTPEHPFRGTFDGQGHTIQFTINAPNSDYQGLFGYMEGTVKNLYLYNCNVTGHDYVGGIAGYCHGTISNCGTKSSYSPNAKVVGNKYVGSLAGMARYAEILNCQNGIKVSGSQHVGGVVGDFVAYKNDDSYGKSGYNINSWGKTLYNIYGGNVSHCFNFGMVKATGDDSYVGGIAGSTSTEVKHSYNSGIVDGKDKVGGIAGQLQGDSIHHCYNVGSVSATGSDKGAVCGMYNAQCTMYNCFYDRQMCAVEDANATALYTREMIVGANNYSPLRTALGDDYWNYHSNEYPRIKYSDTIHSNAAAVSVKPLLLPGYMPADDIVQHFSCVTGDNVEWMHYGTSPETVVIHHLPSQQNRDTIIWLNTCNVDTLQVRASKISQNNAFWERRLVPIEVTGKIIDDTHLTTDTSCTSTYTWEVNGVTYNKSGFYTWGNDCDSMHALNLTIGHISCQFDQIGSTCNDIADGVLMTTVSGGFGNGFRYKWTNSNSDSIGNQPNLMGCARGTYTLTLVDSAVRRCSFTGDVNLDVQPTVALTLAGCSESKTYDGTALTGSRFVVTEEGHLPDTVAASHFAVLSNGDTLRATLDTDTIINVDDTHADGVRINSYTIKNGIDHSCHYQVSLGKGNLTVTPRPVLITVNDASKEVGSDDPAFTGTVSGLINPNDLGDIFYLRTNSTEEVGNYPDVLTATPDSINPNYAVTINLGDFLIDCKHLSTRISNWPTANITGLNQCFYPQENNSPSPNTDTLPTGEQIEALITQSSLITSGSFEIETKDSALKSDNCDWQWARTYTISTKNSGYCDVESRVLYVSGGDQTAPARSINDLWNYGTLPQNACLASFETDKFFPLDVDLFYDCSPMTITHTDTPSGNDRDGWTIRRSYEVTDACGHTIHDSVKVSGRDLTPPTASNPKVKDNTLWADYVQCLCDSIHVINDFDSLVSLFGLSDECTGDDISLVSKTRTFKTGDHCADTVVVAYLVSDPYGNDTTFYHAQFIQDTLGPTFRIVPFNDTTLCVDPDGNYEATVNRIANLVSITDIADNCTKLQESFIVSKSINFDPKEDKNDGYDTDTDPREVTYGKRTYSQVWLVTDSCGNTTREELYIHLYPLATIRIDSLGDQQITYGQDIKDVLIHHQYSNLALHPQNSGGINLYNTDTTGTLRGMPDSAGTFIYTLRATSWHDCNIVDTTVKIKVKPRPITITAASATKKYDGKPLTSNNYICTLSSGFTDINNRILVNNDSIASVTITGTQTDVGTSANIPSDAVITIATETTADKNPSYDISYANGTLTVTTNDTLIKVIPKSSEKVYDGTPLTKNAHSDFTVIGVPEGLTWEATADGIVWNVTPGEGEKAVNAVTSFHIFNAKGADVTAYFTNIHTDSTGTLTITPKPLTITASDSTKEYDGTTLYGQNIFCPYTHTALAPGDSLWSVTITGSQTFAGTSNNVPSDAVIKNDTLKDVTSNYNITYENGKLKVIQKPLTITAGSDTIIYNGYWLTNNTYTHSDLVEGDSLWSVTITGRALYGESDNVPSDAVIKNANEEDVTASYDIGYVNGHLKIKQKKLTITAGDSSKVYDGTVLTCHTFTDTGLVRNDYISHVSMTSNLTWADTIDNDISEPCIQNPDIHDTIVTNCYEIKYVKGKLMVAKKDLTITAGDSSKVYDGTALTQDSFTHTELVPGDSIWSVSMVGSQTVAGTSENVPSEADIQNSSQVKVAANYHITYIPGHLTVTPLAVAVAITGNHDSLTYNATEQTVTGYTASANSTLYQVDGATPDFQLKPGQTASASRTDFGTTMMGLTSTMFQNNNNNFDVTFSISEDGYLAIKKAALNIIAKDQTYTYNATAQGEDNATYTNACKVTTNGLQGSDTLTSVTLNGQETNVGEYMEKIVPSDATVFNNATNNYNITYTAGKLTINPKPVTIIVDDTAKTYGEPDPAFTGSAEGLVNPNDLGDISYFRLNTDDKAVGIYHDTISATYTTNNNYNVTIDKGDFTIKCRNVTMKSDASWPENLTGQNNCFADADTTGLKDAQEIQKLFEHSDEVTVEIQDNATKTSNCDWEWTRTYTISVTGGCAPLTKTMSVSGRNFNKPSFTVPATAIICPNKNGSYNISPDTTGNVSNLFDDCHSSAQLSVTYSDSEIEPLSYGKRQIIRTWTVTDACGNDSSQTQVIILNPSAEITITPNPQTIVKEEPISKITVTNQYSTLNTPTITFNNVATTFDDAGLALQETAQGFQISGTPTDTGTYKIHFTAYSDQIPSCGKKTEDAVILVRLLQDTVTVISDTASKFYDGTPLTCHRYLVLLGTDTIPADEDSDGLVFTVHFHDKLTITPTASLTNVGYIVNGYTCVLDHPEHYKGLKQIFGTLTVNKSTLSMSLDTARAYNGHPFVVTADQLHITGLAATDTITSGTITTEGYTAGTYVCEEGGFNAFMEDGIAVKSGFAINNGLSNYTPDFKVKLTIDPITAGFECPEDLHIVLKEGIADTMLVITDSATLTPMVDNIVISSNLESQNPLPVGTHTIVWTLSDDQGNAMTSCEQTVEVEYTPCAGTEYHDYFYDAKRIGFQCWMTENLHNTQNSHDETIANYHAYKDNEENTPKFGYLYSWYSAMNVAENDDTAVPVDSIGDNGHLYVQGICPKGWAVGSVEDFTALFATVGDATLLKDAGEGYWMPNNGGTQPNSGFNARANGFNNRSTQRYEDLLTGSHFWTPESATTNTTANSAVLQYFCNDGLFQQSPKADLKGVRCIRKVAE